jgi:hypothetical protein
VLGVASASQVRWPVFAFTLPVLDFDSWASSWEVTFSEKWSWAGFHIFESALIGLDWFLRQFAKFLDWRGKL